MAITKQKDNRIDLRASSAQKKAIEQAAVLKQTTVTSFILDAAYEAAQHLIQDQANIALSSADWKQFCQALDHPLSSNTALRKLMHRKSGLGKS